MHFSSWKKKKITSSLHTNFQLSTPRCTINNRRTKKKKKKKSWKTRGASFKIFINDNCQSLNLIYFKITGVDKEITEKWMTENFQKLADCDSLKKKKKKRKKYCGHRIRRIESIPLNIVTRGAAWYNYSKNVAEVWRKERKSRGYKNWDIANKFELVE